MKYYIRIDDNGRCYQSEIPDKSGNGCVYEVCPSGRIKFSRLKNIEYKDGNICSDGEVVCHATPYQKILDKRTLLDYIREEQVLATASGLAPGLFNEDLLDVRSKKNALASKLATQYPEKRSLSLELNDSLGINDVEVSPSGL
tara:strand:- start:931 stop:1359 length:429 start_codon:yes stop_codon:yes gene_type:complete